MLLRNIQRGLRNGFESFQWEKSSRGDRKTCPGVIKGEASSVTSSTWGENSRWSKQSQTKRGAEAAAEREEATMMLLQQERHGGRLRWWVAFFLCEEDEGFSTGRPTWYLQLSLRGPWLLRLIRLPERTIGVRCRTLVCIQPSFSNWIRSLSGSHGLVLGRDETHEKQSDKGVTTVRH